MHKEIIFIPSVEDVVHSLNKIIVSTPKWKNIYKRNKITNKVIKILHNYQIANSKYKTEILI